MPSLSDNHNLAAVSQPLIATSTLQKSYTQEAVTTHALRDISLEILPGEFVAIMGPSGSGKSTLLHILGFLDRPSGGTYLFDGHEMSAYSERDLATIRNQKMGFVFQAFNLLPRTSVLENVLLPLRYSPVPPRQWRARAQEAIAQVQLTHRMDHVPSQLSGGEKQRVAIARALVNRPLVIFADEPTGNLDSASGRVVMETIESFHRHGHTVVLITHETTTAQFAQRIIQLKDGLVVSDQQMAPNTVRHYHK